jgi:nitroreductase
MSSDQMVPEIRARRARRALAAGPVPRETIDRLLQAATLAPSCGNMQPWRFVIAADEPVLSKVKSGLTEGNYWAKNAPVIVLVVTHVDLDARRSDGRDYAFFDTGMATMALLMQATREGLIAHPIAGYDPVAIKAVTGIPGDHVLLALVIIGPPGAEDHLNDKHREQEHSPRARKALAEVAAWNAWSFPQAPRP